jgi:hypothetical protein
LHGFPDLGKPAGAWVLSRVVDRRKKPMPPRVFERGVPLTPADQLVAWLVAQGDHVVRVPLVLTLWPGGVGYAFQNARIGTAPDAPTVSASDGALGIGLNDRLRRHVELPLPETAAILVEARYRDGELYVIAAGQGPLGPGELAAITHAEREVEA